MIRAVLSDLSEVLLTGILGVERPIAWAVGQDPATVNRQMKGSELQALFHGDVTEAGYWQSLITKHSWPVTVSYLRRVVRANFHEIRGTRRVLGEIRESGYRLGLLSVHALEWVEYCQEKFRHHDLFDTVSYSFHGGVSKPDPRAYRIAVDQLQVAPAEIVFIDDQAKNVEAAKRLGMKGVHFSSASQLRRELIKLGVHFNHHA